MARALLALALVLGCGGARLEKSMHHERYAGTLVSDPFDVMTEEEPWRANIDKRARGLLPVSHQRA